MNKHLEKNFVSVVVYLHNNEDTIESFVKIVERTLKSNFEKFEMIFVNDDCEDATVERLKYAFSNETSHVVTLVNMSVYQGVELAMTAGLDLAIGDFVYEFDYVNIDYPEELILDVYKKSLEGNDIVSAVPKRGRRASSTVFYALFNRFSKAPYKLKTERFRILSRRAINRVQTISRFVTYRKAAYATSGLKMSSLDFSTQEKGLRLRAGKDRTHRNTAMESLVLFTDVSQKITLFMTLLLMGITIFAGVYTLFVTFGEKKPIEGWTTTMLLLSAGFSGLFLMIAFILKYLSLLVELVRTKQKYLVSGIEKIT
jgi:glycosyltransferase involved in cell wall biosynthesis